MPNPTLHHIYDPLCGWCYAAAPLVEAAREISGLGLMLHGGGMMARSAAQHVTPELRRYVTPHDQRIAQLTGQPFGEAYFNGLLQNTEAVLDSAPPIAAILAADEIDGRGADMVKAVQRAHYVDGRVISQSETLSSLAVALGLDAVTFNAAWEQQMAGPVDRHIAESRKLLRQVGGKGFPTFALETAEGLRLLDVTPYLGQPARWQAMLAAKLST
ncbi:MAG TPA: DsbA family protein [Rhodocyclaceae bacterium]|nr:DsbA family protein [Rhodocyclaceae bacterium]